MRTTHPYLLHDAIHEQPDCIARFLATQRPLVERAADAAAPRHRIMLLGVGSSHHAAQIGEYFLRHFTRAATAVVEQSFEQVHYPRQFHADDIAIFLSHRGAKNHTVQALKAAQASGALTIGICGAPPSEEMQGADFCIPTCELETCFVHTKSYVTALAALALFAIALTVRRKQIAAEDGEGAIASLARIPDLLRQTLLLEPQAHAAAAPIAERQRWIFIGTGPNWATAREAALKVKESSYLATEGFQTEQFLHGPFSELDSRGVLTGFLAGGAGDYRTHAALRAAGELGALRVACVTRGADSGVPAEIVLEVPPVAEWLSPFLHAAVAQLLSYHVALARGANPDTGRFHETAHAAAQKFF
jgi:glucosamine--fructose-6-phosphate aminotransferase (isomerizing)